MRAAGKKYEPMIYKGAGHGFIRSGEPNDSNVRERHKKARDETWVRWKTLLKQLPQVCGSILRRISLEVRQTCADKLCGGRDPRHVRGYIATGP